MEYLRPEVDVMGSASEMVRAFFGPDTDVGATSLSLGAPADGPGEE
jgi:hypothetical protein